MASEAFIRFNKIAGGGFCALVAGLAGCATLGMTVGEGGGRGKRRRGDPGDKAEDNECGFLHFHFREQGLGFGAGCRRKNVIVRSEGWHQNNRALAARIMG